MSAPNNNTFLFDNANAAAKLIEINVFPSPAIVEVTKMSFP